MKNFDKWARELADKLAKNQPKEEAKPAPEPPSIPLTRPVSNPFNPGNYDAEAYKKALADARARAAQQPKSEG